MRPGYDRDGFNAAACQRGATVKLAFAAAKRLQQNIAAQES